MKNNGCCLNINKMWSNDIKNCQSSQSQNNHYDKKKTTTEKVEYVEDSSNEDAKHKAIQKRGNYVQTTIPAINIFFYSKHENKLTTQLKDCKMKDNINVRKTKGKN